MLFMQLAVASHACPALQPGNEHLPPMSAGTADGGLDMADCGQPDSSAPALCHTHCQDAKSSLDKHEVRTAGPVVVLLMVLPAFMEPALLTPSAVTEEAFLLQRTTAPPIAIRHCCLRI
ncbi:hypothetical protein HQN59_22175 [Schlegelella sp. ID0723]|uniref:Uncharacterized protein n=2 Tax=Piscinibacter koreensis TaxID=2742824 RepID=A0A7Y6NSC8_9BURK|nr:hypothetical protein [Schlegelella koreensis]NUZ08461.1 hypothetical protein [Schlegelella koreensis]